MERLVSVIVPVYNVEFYIHKCIESIINQSYSNIEILLIDDGSTDRSGIICDLYANKYHNIIVKHIKNNGVSNARNIGIDLSSGTYILFADSDDYLDASMISRMVENIEQNNTDISIVNYNLDICGKIIVKKNRVKNSILNRSEFINNICDEQKFGGYLWNKLYKSSLIKNNSLRFKKNIKIMEDLVFNLELSNYIKKVSYLDSNLYYYTQREGSALSKKRNFNNFEVIEILISILDKYNNKYSNDFKLRYVFESKKAEILNSNIVGISNIKEKSKEYNNLFLYLSHGKFSIKIKLIIITFFPKIYK